MLMQISSVRLCHTLLLQLDQGSCFHITIVTFSNGGISAWKNISFTLRATKGDKSKIWVATQVYNIMFRPDSLENNCFYEFFSEYTVQNLPPKPNYILKFRKTRPGYNNRGVTETKVYFYVPMIYMPTFKDLIELEMNKKSLHIDQSTVDSRNVYALRALI